MFTLRFSSTLPPIANALSAFGGALLLSETIHLFSFSWAQNAPMLAFFLGSLIGLLCLKYASSLWKHLSSATLTFITAGLSLFIYCLLNTSSLPLTPYFDFFLFLLLTLRSGSWFYARAMRASSVSEETKSLPLIEMGYYLGMIGGFIVLRGFHFDLNISEIVLIDIVLQTIAGFLECLKKKPSSVKMPPPQTPSNVSFPQPKNFSLILFLVLLTIDIQAVLFGTLHLIPKENASYLMASFYSGVATAAFIAHYFKLLLSSKGKRVLISLHHHSFPLYLLILIASFSVLLVLYYSHLEPTNILAQILAGFSATFSYEFIFLGVLNHLKETEKHLKHSKSVIQAYGYMSIGVATAVWVIGQSNSPLSCAFWMVALSTNLTLFMKNKYSETFKVNQLLN